MDALRSIDLAPALDEGGLEQMPRVARAFTAFAQSPAPDGPKTAGILAGALAILPSGSCLELVFHRPLNAGAVRAQMALGAPLGGDAAHRLLDHLAPLVAPGARLQRAARAWPAGPAVTAVRPESLDLRRLPDIGPAPHGPDAVHSPVSDPSRWPFDVPAALRAALSEPGRQLVIRIGVEALDARVRRAVEQLKLALGVRAARGDRSDGGRGLWSLASDLGAEDHCLSIEVELHQSSTPDGLTLDLVSLALFGARADRTAVTDQVDLRRLWPAGWALPVLAPSHRAMSPLLSLAGEQAECACAPCDLRIGTDVGDSPVMLTAADRARHLYVIGGTGTGKSTLLLNLIAQDMRNGEGVILFDPHGDLADQALALVPDERRGDLIFADAGDPDGAFGFNLLAGYGADAAQSRNYAANSLIRLFTRLLYAGVPEAFGPMFEIYFRNALLLLMEAQGTAADLMDFDAVFLDGAFRRSLLSRCADPKVTEFWTGLVPNITHDEMTLNNITPYVTCKLTQITGNPLMRRLLCRPMDGIDLRRAMDDGRILILKAPSGLLGRSDAELLASITMNQIAGAAMSRAELSPADRRPVRLYVDEFQLCVGEGLADLLAEARKFGLSMVLANQSLSQVDGGPRRSAAADAVLANAANLISLRVGAPDAARLGSWFAPDIEWPDLVRLPDYHAIARLLDRGRPAQARALRLEAPPG